MKWKVSLLEQEFRRVFADRPGGLHERFNGADFVGVCEDCAFIHITTKHTLSGRCGLLDSNGDYWGGDKCRGRLWPVKDAAAIIAAAQLGGREAGERVLHDVILSQDMPDFLKWQIYNASKR